MRRAAPSKPSIFRFLTSINDQYSFICHRLESIRIAGKRIQSDWIDARELTLQTRYIARWAPAFLGLGDDLLVIIPVGDAAVLSADGRFRNCIRSVGDTPRAATAA
jgi:hypothetical protein